MVKRGDTLVEVTLAVGIFSMVVVAVVAIMSNGTSETQTALETTLTREEIDTQAEALRFIHASASAESSATTGRLFTDLWNTIKGNVVDLSEVTQEVKNPFLNFSPTDCAEVYSPLEGDKTMLQKQHAFFINPKKLGTDNKEEKQRAYVSANDTYLFRPTETYPRIVFESSVTSSQPPRAEGIFVVGVKSYGSGGPGSSSGSGSTSAYYDFYIRTCWYGANADQPSTISTVIRLSDI